MKAYLTLDYELFLSDRTGDVTSCLLRPMEALSSLANVYSAHLNVFVDAAYLIRLRELGEKYPQLQRDFLDVTNNIKLLDAQGHYIQLHLHPQWLYSIFNGDNWEMDKTHYKLSDLPLEKQKSLIKEGVDLLNSFVTKPVKAYRAGGYSINNFGQLADDFWDNGIRYDTSVLRGEKTNTRYQEYNYSKIPLESSYSFETSPVLPGEGRFIEYPISTIVVTSLRYLIEKRRGKALTLNNASTEKWGNGVGIGYPGSSLEKLLIKGKHLLGEKAIRASIDGLGGSDLERVYRHCMKHYTGDAFVIIGHPKLTTPYSLKCLESFIINHPDVKFEGFK